MPISTIDDFNQQLKEHSSAMTSQLNDFIEELIPKVSGSNPITTDAYQVSFNFGTDEAKKIAKAKIMVSVAAAKPGKNLLQILLNKKMPPIVKVVKLGPVSYVFCNVPVYGTTQGVRQINVNPANGSFDKGQVKDLIDNVIGELIGIYVDFNKTLED